MLGDEESAKHISVQVQDKGKTPYTILLSVEEVAEKGVIEVADDKGAVLQKHVLTQMRRNGKGDKIVCKVDRATVTITIDGEKTPPDVRLVATLFFPIIDTTYTLSHTEQQRLVAWIRTLAISALS
jgi:hypothetical protein